MLQTKRFQELSIGVFKCSISRTNDQVEINGLKTEHGLTVSTRDFLHSAVGFLSTEVVATKVPHAALPIEWSELLLSFSIGPQLSEYGRNYKARFGVPDQLGKESIFSGKDTNDAAGIVWGAGAAELKVDRKRNQVSLRMNVSPVSIELMTDILVALLRDPYTATSYPDFSAPYLRRWGENAFDVANLKRGLPKLLTAGELINNSQEGAIQMVANTASKPPERNKPRGATAKNSMRSEKVVASDGRSSVSEAADSLKAWEEELGKQAAKLDKLGRRLASKENWLNAKREILQSDDDSLDRVWRNLQVREERLAQRELALEEETRLIASREEDLKRQGEQLDRVVRDAKEVADQSAHKLCEAEEKFCQAEGIRAQIEKLLKVKFELE